MNIRNRFALITLLVMIACSSNALPQQIEEEIRRSLIRLAESGQLNEGSTQVIERPAERVADLGLLVDRRGDASGLLVLGTLPGGSAERIGIRAGDRLIAANGMALRDDGAETRLRRLVNSWDENEELQLDVIRDGAAITLTGTMHVLHLPAIRVELAGSAATTPSVGDGILQGDARSRCARVTTFPSAPRSRDLFPVQLQSIDGGVVGPLGEDTFRLSPGKHVLRVAERIDDHYFSSIGNHQRRRADPALLKEIEIDAKPGVTYWLAARFDRSRSHRVLEGEYWQPVLWKQQIESCR